MYSIQSAKVPLNVIDMTIARCLSFGQGERSPLGWHVSKQGDLIKDGTKTRGYRFNVGFSHGDESGKRGV